MTDITVEALDEDTPNDVREMVWLRKILPVLTKEYPGYQWLVNVDVIGGVAQIALPFETKAGHVSPWAWVIHLRTYTDEKVKLAGGELLERWKLSRTRAASDTYTLAKSNGIDASGATWAPSWAKGIS